MWTKECNRNIEHVFKKCLTSVLNWKIYIWLRINSKSIQEVSKEVSDARVGDEYGFIIEVPIGDKIEELILRNYWKTELGAIQKPFDDLVNNGRK